VSFRFIPLGGTRRRCRSPHRLDDIRDSIARRGARDLAHSTHALLSFLGAFGAHDASHLTQQFEAQGREENCHTDETFAALEKETAGIHLALAAFTPCEASTPSLK
jgi:HPt (histidine-containing phosphotransfer) domain-containing protein